MISSIRRASRIKKLLDPLMDYLSSLPSIRETYRRENRSGETVIDAVVFRAVWVTEGDPSPIDDYIALNPNHPNRSDLREIESWKSGISHEFPVIRSEGVVLFLYGDHVSAVRGIDDEIDTRADLPTYIFTVILSFDGLITYGLAMKVATNDHDPAVDAAFSTVELMCARRQRVSVRTARQFLKAAPVARELKRQAAPEDGDLGQAPSDPTGGTARAAEGEAHTGSLPTADTAPSLSLAKSVVSPPARPGLRALRRALRGWAGHRDARGCLSGDVKGRKRGHGQGDGTQGPEGSDARQDIPRQDARERHRRHGPLRAHEGHEAGRHPKEQLERLVEHGGRLELASGDFHSLGDIHIPEPPNFASTTSTRRT